MACEIDKVQPPIEVLFDRGCGSEDKFCGQ